MAHAGTMSPGYEGTVTGARWVQLLLGFLVMMTISSPQYVWTLFVPSFQKICPNISRTRPASRGMSVSWV